MTTQNERLRALLDEAREALTSYPQESEDVCRLLNRIDAALAEPVEDLGVRVCELEAMLGFQKDSNASDLRLLRATEAALDSTQVEIDKANKDLSQARAEAAAYKRDFEAELAGNAVLRKKHGARENETMFDFIARMVRERDEARAEVERLREGEECHIARPGEETYECRIDNKCPACELRFHRIRYERYMNGIK